MTSPQLRMQARAPAAVGVLVRQRGVRQLTGGRARVRIRLAQQRRGVRAQRPQRADNLQRVGRVAGQALVRSPANLGCAHA